MRVPNYFFTIYTYQFKVIFILCIFINLTKQCTSSGYHFENYLGTVTPYRIVSNKSFDPIEYKGCTQKKIWMLVRHGTRNPSLAIIEKMNKRLPILKKIILENDNLPNEFIKSRDIDLFRKWQVYLDIKEEKKLAHEGEEEMLVLAERMQSRFPVLFENSYSNTSYQLKYTYSQRTKKSANYFVAGLFGRKTGREVWFPEPLKKDPILRFYKLCDKWNVDIKRNPKTTYEKNTFEQGFYMNETVKSINRKLHLQEVLNADDIALMYTTCGFETAWNKKSKSPWCSPFDVDDLKVLEYVEDLKYYWQDGYGYELTYKQACPAFQDMINFLSAKDRFPKVNIYFTHSGTILKMLAHMELYKDNEHLTADNYLKMKQRKWRTSLIDSFASNLAFISFSCDGRNHILTLHQENIVRLPSCPTTDLCEIEEIVKFYNQSINNCNFKEICNI